MSGPPPGRGAENVGLDDGARRSPLRDELTGEVVVDPDGLPITELEGHDYLGLADSISLEERAAGERAWRYGHVIVDEAQDLTPMQWRMVARRARGHSMTLVGDLAQRTSGSASAWSDLLPPELGEVGRHDLTTNYRSPTEVATLTTEVLAELAPGLDPPMSIRSSGSEPTFARVPDVHAALPGVVDGELARVDPGRVAVIAVDPPAIEAERVTSLRPEAAKGMEFDSVVVVEPADIVAQQNGLALLYIALSRTTHRLVVLHSRELPSSLEAGP